LGEGTALRRALPLLIGLKKDSMIQVRQQSSRVEGQNNLQLPSSARAICSTVPKTSW
jgi:hypothetical protein